MISRKFRTTTIITAFIIMLLNFVVFAAEAYVRHTAYNVVFIMDTSGSLEIPSNGYPPTDPYKLRITALNQILSWLQGTNSKIGIMMVCLIWKIMNWKVLLVVE